MLGWNIPLPVDILCASPPHRPCVNASWQHLSRRAPAPRIRVGPGMPPRIAGGSLCERTACRPMCLGRSRHEHEGLTDYLQCHEPCEHEKQQAAGHRKPRQDEVRPTETRRGLTGQFQVGHQKNDPAGTTDGPHRPSYHRQYGREPSRAQLDPRGSRSNTWKWSMPTTVIISTPS